MNLMTQKDLAEKYHEDRAVITRILKKAGIEPVDTTKEKYPKNLYPEYPAAVAIRDYYMERQRNLERRASGWREAANNVVRTYNGGKRA